ncbi:hypothetical protein [Arthrobacter sp. B1805]|uniref:hypothetical protein n=1 Tax=Arthrobacter sp. B1805 TaxID=2058892 RepID=UPI0015E46167|nr:hypothetical protein [Arthrobacter sp. B1805]
MGSVDLGGTAKVSLKGTVAAGANIALAVTQPDGLTLNPAPIVDQEGKTATLVPTMPGRHLLRWLATGTETDVFTDVLDVWPADPRFIISLEEAENGLRWRNPSAADREDLRLYIAAATEVIEDIVGPMVASTYIHHAAGGGSVVLPHIPSQVIAVTIDGLPVVEYYADFQSGIVYAGTRYHPASFVAGDVAVTYSFGSPIIPPNVRLAARELVRHWWQIGMQGQGAVRGQEPTADAFTPSGFAVPRRVVELCSPHQQIGGFA